MLGTIFIFLAFFAFIPIGRLGILPVAPYNAFIYIFIIYLLLYFPKFKKNISTLIIWLFAIFIFYIFYELLVDIVKTEPYKNFFAKIRALIFSLSIILFASNAIKFQRAYKIILYIILLSTLWGLLVYLFGEPLSSIREYLIEGENIFIQQKGQRVVGLSSSIFSFSYILSVGIVMSVGLYFAETKNIHLLIIIILAMGVILNGERSSALSSLICIILFVSIHHRQKFKKCIVLLFAIMICSASINYFVSRPVHETADYANLFHRFGEERKGEYIGRMLQAEAGVITLLKNPLIGGKYSTYQDEARRLFWKRTGNYIATGKEIPAPHNHYVNIGMRSGVLGIILLLSFLYVLKKITSVVYNKNNIQENFKIYYIAACYAFISVMGNALFHNNGIFYAETATWALIGLLAAGSNLNMNNNSENE